MPCKGGRRKKEKRLKFQIKTAFQSGTDPFPYFTQLAQLQNQSNKRDISNSALLKESAQKELFKYSIKKIEFDYKYPDYKIIKKGDPRRYVYKIRCLFGTGGGVKLPKNFPILPPERI